MYLVLFVFGALLTIAGVVLGTSGVSIHDRAFDPSLVTPGVVAAAGGLLLIGLGFALRVLQRIEMALASRPMPRAVRPAEAATTAEVPSEAARIPLPSKPALAASPPPAASVEAKQPQHVRVQLPSLAKLDSALAVHETGSELPNASLRVDEAVGELNGGRAVRQRNGGASARTAPRLDAGGRTGTPSERSKGPAFDALWPKAPRLPHAAPPPAALTASPSAIEPEQGPEPAPAAALTPEPEETSAEASVLKSGVVDGMAYTLFSDGSIEAQLPQGTLRFGSITELRIHIEQSPSDTAVS